MSEERKIMPCVKQFLFIRKAKNMSAQDVSDICGVDVNSIRSYETGRRIPNLRTMEKLVQAVGGSLTVGGWA